MMIHFIRHARTAGNCEKRYIGKTDEPLCEEGIRQIRQIMERKPYPRGDMVIASPMKRCLETAELLYPGIQPFVCEGFREIDFGSFEGKNYEDLKGDGFYQSWIDSGGTLPFPGGERKEAFCRRCTMAYEELMDQYRDKRELVFVVHGGTIMAVLEKYACPKKGYFEWQVSPGACLSFERSGKYQLEEAEQEKNKKELPSKDFVV